MVFSSPVFLCIFLPSTLALYYACPAGRRNWVALVASLFFYSWGAPRFLFVLIGSSCFDYALSRYMCRPDRSDRGRKATLVTAVAVNLGVLVYFKYMNFLVGQAHLPLDGLGMSLGTWIDIALPIGISFFTFQKLSYLVDVYRGVVGPARSLPQYLLYVSLFPQLIAGPIVRYHDVARQLVERTLGTEKILQGFWRFGLGLGKKVLIANAMGRVADRAFADPAALSTPAAWLGVFCYSFQIYFDFSGYSDMAIGLGKMLGFEFLENFNLPYIASSFTEFWRRWHISLTNWMKEYLYIPLGGNRRGRMRGILNLWIVFLLSGLWHGASWNFVIWGIYHGFFLSLDRFTAGIRRKIPGIIGVPVTFVLVSVGWVFFRAETLPLARAYAHRLLSWAPGSAAQPLAGWVSAQEWWIMGVAAFFSFGPAALTRLREPDWAIRDAGPGVPAAIIFRFALTACLLAMSFAALVTTDFNPFIYFRF